MSRHFLLGVALALITAFSAHAQDGAARFREAGKQEMAGHETRLQFRRDGTFKILVISDLHYIPEPDLAAISLTEDLIDLEKPDLVIVDGDNISGDRCNDLNDIKAAVANVAAAMERKKTPWAVVLGNHDQDHFERTQVTKEQVFDLYESYPHNVNGGWVRDISGAGNKNLLLWSADSAKPLWNIWLLDSGGPHPEFRYEWIKPDQLAWYWYTSKTLEQTYGAKVPGLMFFHIPLPEFRDMVMSKKIIGERHEPESPSNVNSGLFSAVLDRKDIKAIFCGHDHVNNYLGWYRGVALGQVGVVGYHGYPHTPVADVTNDRARGARVIVLDEKQPGQFTTWMRFRDRSVNWEAWSGAYTSAELKQEMTGLPPSNPNGRD